MIEQIIFRILDWIHWLMFAVGCIATFIGFVVWYGLREQKDERIYHKELERRSNEITDDM